MSIYNPISIYNHFSIPLVTLVDISHPTTPLPKTIKTVFPDVSGKNPPINGSTIRWNDVMEDPLFRKEGEGEDR